MTPLERKLIIFHFSEGEEGFKGNLRVVRYRAPYLSALNFLLFCVFMGCLWGYSTMAGVAHAKFGPTEIQMLMLQSVSMLLLIGAIQMSPKKEKMWRAVLVGLAFIALSESSLVAFLTPVG